MFCLSELLIYDKVVADVVGVQFFADDYLCWRLRDARGTDYTPRRACKFGIYDGNVMTFLTSDELISFAPKLSGVYGDYFNVIDIPFYNILRHFGKGRFNLIFNAVYNYSFDYSVWDRHIQLDGSSEIIPISCSAEEFNRDVWKYELIHGRLSCKGSGGVTVACDN